MCVCVCVRVCVRVFVFIDLKSIKSLPEKNKTNNHFVHKDFFDQRSEMIFSTNSSISKHQQNQDSSDLISYNDLRFLVDPLLAFLS